METEASAELVGRDNVVIATGGGTVMNPEENGCCFHDGGGVICFLEFLWRLYRSVLKGINAALFFASGQAGIHRKAPR